MRVYALNHGFTDNGNDNGSEDVNKGTTLFYKDKFIRTLRLRFG